MTPIINPWIFYWMSVVDNIGVAAVTVFVASIVLLFIYCLEDQMEKRFVILLLATALLSGVLSLFVPTSETITKMLLAQNVTYERVEVATDTVKNVYEDIMALFEDGDSK